jgi:hypothetical protein
VLALLAALTALRCHAGGELATAREARLSLWLKKLEKGIYMKEQK